MEHAIYINKISDIKFIEKGKFERIYFGNEFCERIIPSDKDVIKILDFADDRGMNFTFVTPWSTDKGIKSIKKILPTLPKNTEVIFNDWGVFRIIKKYRLKPTMGRLLVTTRRDPAISQANPHINFLKSSNLKNNTFQNFLIENLIERVEIDNVIQEHDFCLNKKIKASLYYPFVYIASGKKCIAANCGGLPNKRIMVTKECNIDCSKYILTAKINGLKERVIIKGNTCFYRNKNKPSNINHKDIDRMVYMPKIPL